MGKGLCWKLGRGTNILVGIDPVIRLGKNYLISPYISEELSKVGFITMDLIKHPLWLHHSDTYWILAMDVGMGSRWVEEWDKYIFSLN